MSETRVRSYWINQRWERGTQLQTYGNNSSKNLRQYFLNECIWLSQERSHIYKISEVKCTRYLWLVKLKTLTPLIYKLLSKDFRRSSAIIEVSLALTYIEKRLRITILLSVFIDTFFSLYLYRYQQSSGKELSSIFLNSKDLC